MTHFIEPDQPTLTRSGLRRAVCGQRVPPEDFSTEPTCPVCAASVDEDTALLRRIAANPDYGKADGHA